MTVHRLPHLLLTVTLALCLTPTRVDSSSRVTRSQPASGNDLVEEFSFLIKDFKVDHQGENNLNISVRYRYKAKMSVPDYPDFRLIAKDIETFLTNYPNETDYWEIVNKKITELILKKYSTLVSVTSQIEVSPSATVPYLRSSIATRTRLARRRN